MYYVLPFVSNTTLYKLHVHMHYARISLTIHKHLNLKIFVSTISTISTTHTQTNSSRWHHRHHIFLLLTITHFTINHSFTSISSNHLQKFFLGNFTQQQFFSRRLHSWTIYNR